MNMHQNERWLIHWQQYMDFLNEYHRRPSKNKPEEMALVNWMKYNRKVRNKGRFNPKREELYQMLVALSDTYRRVNKEHYINGEVFIDITELEEEEEEPTEETSTDDSSSAAEEETADEDIAAEPTTDSAESSNESVHDRS